LFRRRDVQAGTDRESVWIESVTYPLGIKCYLSAQNRPRKDWRRRPDLNRGWRFCRFRSIVQLLIRLALWSWSSAVFGGVWALMARSLARSSLDFDSAAPSKLGAIALTFQALREPVTG